MDARVVLCTVCLRRQFGKTPGARELGGLGMTKDQTGCSLCKGVFLKLDEIGKKIIERLAHAKGVATFAIGTSLPDETEAVEERAWETAGFDRAECMKGELNRELGKWVERHSEFRFSRSPDARVLYNLADGSVGLSIAPVYVFGRYRKLERGVRQTKKGEEHSVEGLIEPFFLKASGGSRAVLHGHGREDVDVLMLGEGRPFVVEIQKPEKRNLDLKEIQRRINGGLRGRVSVGGLRIVGSDSVELWKGAHFDKLYEAVVETKEKISKPDLAKLRPTLLFQRTPTRVLKRRSDKVRKREVKELKASLIDGHHVKLTIKTESGTYVKEFVSGDGGRTKPSVSDMLGTEARCIQLNVLAVNSGWLEDWW